MFHGTEAAAATRLARGAALVFAISIAVVTAGPPTLAETGARGSHNSSAVESADQARYIVVFNDNESDPRGLAVALARQHGFNVRLVYSAALKGFSASLSANALDALSRDPRVAYVEADQLAHTLAQTVPTGVQRTFADANPNITIDGTDDDRVDVDVAVVDTGVANHADLNVVGRTDCTGNPFNMNCTDGSGDDGHGHGTHVAGTIGAIDNGIGVVGVAPGARIHSVKVLKNNGSGWISNIIGGVDWVTAHNIPVANMSLGGGNSDALCQAVENSVSRGTTYAVAAGNDNANAAGSSPANCSGVITVSALADFDGAPGGSAASTCRSDQDDTLADFSNWGNTVEIAAPGVCILSTWNDGGYNTISGTSMASPHVAGAAALLASTGMGPAAISAALTASGNSDWTDDSGDGVQEPLLDVSNQAVFAPVTVPGGGGGEPLNTAPEVLITSPADGDTFFSGATIAFDGTADDAEEGSLAAGLTWTSNLDDSIGSGESFSAVLSDGTHVITAAVTDADGASGSDAVTITVGTAPPPPSGTMHVGAIDMGKKGPNLNSVVTILDDSGAAVAGASVDSVRLTLDAGNGIFECGVDGDTCWNFQPLSTDSSGRASYKLLHAPAGNYEFEVLGLSHSTLTWDQASDLDNPQYYP